MVKKKAKKTKKKHVKAPAKKAKKPVSKKPTSKKSAAKKTKRASPLKPAPAHGGSASDPVDSLENGWDGGVDDVSGAAEPLDGFDEAGI